MNEELLLWSILLYFVVWGLLNIVVGAIRMEKPKRKYYGLGEVFAGFLIIILVVIILLT